MAQAPGFPDLLQWTREVSGDQVLYRLKGGLQIRTEVFHKADTLRILPLGTPQGAIMNHLLNFPEVVRGRQVFEPFAGSGALGFTALHAGAPHVDFLDINPRAAEFHRGNAGLNGIASDRFTSIRGDIAEFTPRRPYDVMLANPPFVPTPDGIVGTITSNGGPDGNRFVRIVLERFDELLQPTGCALLYVLQFVRRGRPLIADLVEEILERRPVSLTPCQEHEIPLAAWCAAYVLLFPDARAGIERWSAALAGRHGSDLALCHYIAEIGPRSEVPTGCTMRDDFGARFGDAFRVPSDDVEELAFGRVFENVVRGPDSA